MVIASRYVSTYLVPDYRVVDDCVSHHCEVAGVSSNVFREMESKK